MPPLNSLTFFFHISDLTNVYLCVTLFMSARRVLMIWRCALKEGEGEKEFLTAHEAVQYLAEKWGVESYSVGTFRAYRRRHELKPDLGTENASLWRRETLDRIPKPNMGRPRGTTRSKKQHAEEKSEEAA